MKIAEGMFYHEANSFNPHMVMKNDFIYEEGQNVIDRMYATEIFRKAGAQILPLVYVNTLPNGICSKEAYDFYSARILALLEQNRDVDGVMLHLHGSMEVEELGSGEYDLIKRIRVRLGEEVIIGLALDAHANNHPKLAEMVNVIRNYRTVPHTDQKATEQTVAVHMVDCIENHKKTVPQYVRLPYAIHPEKATGATWPLCEIYEKLWETERRKEVSVATLGIGMVWCDCETLASNVIVTPSDEKYTQECREIAQELADYIYAYKDSFEFEQVPMNPHEAVRFSVQYPEAPVYLSDSGDNTTGGAVGDHTIILREYLKLRDFNGKRVLVTSIWDEKAVAECMKHEEGEKITVTVGNNYDENTKAVTVTGILKKKGKLFGYMGCEHNAVGEAVTISTEQVDFVIINKPGSFISVGHFTEGAGLTLEDYQVIVVKQGYLFAELRKLARLAILALTPGATHQIIGNLEYHKAIPPVYPLNIKPLV